MLSVLYNHGLISADSLYGSSEQAYSKLTVNVKGHVPLKVSMLPWTVGLINPFHRTDKLSSMGHLRR